VTADRIIKKQHGDFTYSAVCPGSKKQKYSSVTVQVIPCSGSKDNGMARRNIYFKEKTEREVQDLVQIEIQDGATNGDVNFSSVVNELIGIGLMVKNIRGGE